MKTKEFTASKIALETNKSDNYYLFGLADDPDAPDNYILFQRSIKDDEQDEELGMNTYHFEANDQGYSSYGACDEVVLSADQIIIKISKKAKNIAKKFDTIIVHFKASEKKHTEIVKMLGLIFRDNENVLVVRK